LIVQVYRAAQQPNLP